MVHWRRLTMPTKNASLRSGSPSLQFSFLLKMHHFPKWFILLAIWKWPTKNIENLSACVRASCPPLSIEFTKRYIQLLSFSWAVRYECGVYVYGLWPSYCSAHFTSAAMSCLCWRMWPGFSKGTCLLSNHMSAQPQLSSSTINQTELRTYCYLVAIVHYNNCSQQLYLCTCVLKIFTLWPGHSEVCCAADYTPHPQPIARFKHHECRVNLALSHAPLFGPFSPVRGAATYLMLISNPNPVLLGNYRGRQWLSVLTFRWRIGAGVTMAAGTCPLRSAHQKDVESTAMWRRKWDNSCS